MVCCVNEAVLESCVSTVGAEFYPTWLYGGHDFTEISELLKNDLLETFRIIIPLMNSQQFIDYK